MAIFMTDGITEPRSAGGLIYEESGWSHQVVSGLFQWTTDDEVVETIIQDVIIDYMVDEKGQDDNIILVPVKAV